LFYLVYIYCIVDNKTTSSKGQAMTITFEEYRESADDAETWRNQQ